MMLSGVKRLIEVVNILKDHVIKNVLAKLLLLFSSCLKTS